MMPLHRRLPASRGAALSDARESNKHDLLNDSERLD